MQGGDKTHYNLSIREVTCNFETILLSWYDGTWKITATSKLSYSIK